MLRDINHPEAEKNLPDHQNTSLALALPTSSTGIPILSNSHHSSIKKSNSIKNDIFEQQTTTTSKAIISAHGINKSQSFTYTPRLERESKALKRRSQGDKVNAFFKEARSSSGSNTSSYPFLTEEERRRREGFKSSNSSTQNSPCYPQYLNEDENRRRDLYKEARIQSGLEGDYNPTFADISRARLKLAECAADMDSSFILPVLYDLQYLIAQDPCTEQSADDLLPLLSMLGELNNPTNNHRSMRVSIALAKTFGNAAEIILHQQYLKNLKGITHEWKRELEIINTGLSRLNRKSDLALNFEVKFALQCIIRFKSDHKYIQETLTRLYHLSMVALAYFSETDINISAELTAAFDDFHIYFKRSWFQSTFCINRLKNLVLYGPEENRHGNLKILMSTHSKDLFKQWTFTYAMLQNLTEVILKGSTEEIRILAFKGASRPIDYSAFPMKKAEAQPLDWRYCGLIDIIPIYIPENIVRGHISLTTGEVFKDRHNEFLQITAIENLIRIVKESPDRSVRHTAEEILRSRKATEEDTLLLKELIAKIPNRLENKTIKNKEKPRKPIEKKQSKSRPRDTLPSRSRSLQAVIPKAVRYGKEKDLRHNSVELSPRIAGEFDRAFLELKSSRSFSSTIEMDRRGTVSPLEEEESPASESQLNELSEELNEKS